MSNLVDLSVFVATYKDESSAKSDYEAVKALHSEFGFMDTFDAAIVEKTEEGKVKIVKKHEEPTRQEGFAGAGVGLAAGLLAALFPAVALTGALVAGTTVAGAAIGALVGHVTAGMNRSDLKELGEALDEGEYGLIVVAVTDVGERIQDAISFGEKLVKKDLKADKKVIDKEIREILGT